MVTRVLVTGFGPFLDVAANPSELLAKALGQVAWPEAIEVQVLSLPTSFQRSRELLKAHYEAFKPHGLLCLGVGRNEGLRLERRAHAIVTSEHADIDGEVWTGRVLGDELKSVLPVDMLRSQLASTTELPLSLSDHCGGYVCNALYQEALNLSQGQALFVHLEREAMQQAEAFKQALETLLKAFAWQVGQTWQAADTRLSVSALENDAHAEMSYRLHLWALHSEADPLTPGYARQDEVLRRGAGGRKKGGLAIEWKLFSDVASAEVVPPQEKGWFQKRQAFGEQTEIQRRTLALSEQVKGLLEALQLSQGPRLEVKLALSPTLRPWPFSLRTDGALVLWCGVETPAELVLLALLSELTWPEVVLGESIEGVRHRLLLGGSALVAARPSEALLETMLEAATRDVLLPQHRGEEMARWIERLAPSLDQAPGEVERMAHGLARRRSDRLHRAWLRGFFVPRGVTYLGSFG